MTLCVCVYTTRASTQRQQTQAIFGHGSDGERSKRRKKNRESKENFFKKFGKIKKNKIKKEEMMIVRRWPVIVVRLSTKIRKRKKKNRRADHRLENEFRHPSP